MGIFVSCCKGTSEELITPDKETRRRQLAEAAERRLQDNQNRGIKDPERVRRMEKKAEELERYERENAMKGPGEAPLRWQMN